MGYIGDHVDVIVRLKQLLQILKEKVMSGAPIEEFDNTLGDAHTITESLAGFLQVTEIGNIRGKLATIHGVFKNWHDTPETRRTVLGLLELAEREINKLLMRIGDQNTRYHGKPRT